MYDKYRDRDVVFIGLTSEGASSLSGIRKFLSETGVPWVNGYGARDTLAAFQNSYIPQMWVIGPDGRVVWNRASSGDLEDGIEQALALKDAQQ